MKQEGGYSDTSFTRILSIIMSILTIAFSLSTHPLLARSSGVSSFDRSLTLVYRFTEVCGRALILSLFALVYREWIALTLGMEFLVFVVIGLDPYANWSDRKLHRVLQSCFAAALNMIAICFASSDEGSFIYSKTQLTERETQPEGKAIKFWNKWLFVLICECCSACTLPSAYLWWWSRDELQLFDPDIHSHAIYTSYIFYIESTE